MTMLLNQLTHLRKLWGKIIQVEKDIMERDVTVNIIAQLQRLNAELKLDPYMLRFTVASSVDRAALQLIHRPSVGCNNQL
ncbi:hypothetical protein EJD97_025533 [Solanum chilense]|uniref:Uncharacterized protein n=1 Tax=Solanum chilense TaxID=4083 RepID=A0A6N2C074_SOLCI|nr:hypothetical protein EJD97_025533 [Solanum chilense]